MEETEKVIEKIKDLVNQKGYVYALCMIILEDFHINPEKLHEIDTRGRLSVKEASLLLGFLIQDEIDFSIPETPQDLINLKQKTYKLMEELHESFMAPFIEKLENSIKKENKIDDFRVDQKNFFGTGDMLIEPIFYSGTGVYDFQYMEFFERKYKYDIEWLACKKEFDINQAQHIVFKIKSILQEKSQKVHLYDLKERMPAMFKSIKEKNSQRGFIKHIKDILPMMELYQYVELFFEYAKVEEGLSIDKIRKYGWKSFYKSLIELFIVKKSDFDSSINVESFFNYFSITPQKGSNSQFKTIGNYNLINSHPIIKLDDDRYFIPITFLLFEAVYESPFYWMMGDKEYRDQAGKNRGTFGEEITYDFLSKVFGTSRTFKSVKVITKKGQTYTDIDVLCILGSKALCVQVKSKKLTELSRTGDDKALNNDFKGAVQDAYEQGLVSREKILEKSAMFIDEVGNEIKLSEEIDDVYIMVITTENYPALAHQTQVMLEKNKKIHFQ
ncbi:NERD domain-containing protein [Petroclostridium xylanilyticum]|uniref:NERD domain-containing protein n=1 Tax=Petroclostridium xylanilyticum TaxID=1792311 RepID=UPI000B998655|nr:NERD domain-containing protein [Petroclostridium xylanilyticum]